MGGRPADVGPGDRTAAFAAPLVGREPHVQVIRAHLDAVATGRGGLLGVVGPAGTGKSRLLSVAGGVAAGAGMTVLRGRAAAGPSRPLALVSELVPGPPATAGRGPHAVFVVAEQLLSELEARARTGPHLVLLEDLHRADEGSLGVLGYVVDRLPDLTLGVVASWRPAGPATGVEALAAAPATGILTVGPLDDDQQAELVANRLGARPGPRLRELCAASGGNPFLLHELLDGLLAEGRLRREGQDAETVGEIVPASLRARIAAQAGRLPGGAAQTLRIAALLGTRVVAELVTAATGRALDAVVDDLQSAVDAGLLVDTADGDLAFRHDLVQQALVDGLTPGLRRALHRAICDRLATHDAVTPTVVAQHAAADAGVGDEDAVRWLQDAAREELAVAPRTAIGRLERALVLTSDPATARSLTVDLARAVTYVGDLRRAETLLAELDRSSPSPADDAGERRDEAALRAEVLFMLGRLPEAAREFEQLARAGHPHAQLRLADAAMSRLLTGDLDGAAALAEEAAAFPVADEDPRGTAGVGGVRALVAGLRLELEEGLRQARLAVSVAEREPAAHAELPWLNLGQLRCWSQDPDGAIAAFREGRRAAGAAGLAWQEPMYAALSATAHELAGRWDDAVAEAEGALAVARDVSFGSMGAWPYATLAAVHCRRGQLDEADRLLSEAEAAVGRGAAQGADLVARERIRALRAQGRHDAAVAAAQFLWSRLCASAVRLRLAELLPVVRDVADDAGADDLHRLLDRGRDEHLGSLPPGTWARAQVVLDRARRRVDPDRADAALRAVRGTSSETLVADAQRTVALVHARAGTGDRARRRARAAHAALHRLGAIASAEQLRRQVAAHGITLRRPRRPVVGWVALTPSERRVVAAVVHGLTNGDIADELTVSRRTVESHLYHVFAKVGVANRAELAAEAVRRGVELEHR